ncbi:uncharacterized protein G2W53_009836 [Senna tora]|uniref:Uncharacterized protein n=1 Tax=Senna tora TaxID=362788 RepID=A0A835CDC1_9FABA|nr:uncharacterized protein G2W53_009836 [Senna tora]
MLRLESSWHGRCVDHVLTYSGRQMAVDLRNLHGLRSKRLVAKVSQTRRFANRSGFDAPIGIVVAWEERGSCHNIFRTTNRGRISETFMNYEAKDLLRKNLHELRGKKTCCASESNTSIRAVFANRSGFDAPIGVVLAWEEHGSCLNIFRTMNHGRSQKPSRITRQKTCCASESNTSIRVVLANESGFDAPIGVVLAWEERGSFLNIFRTMRSDLRNLHKLPGKRLVAHHGSSVDYVLTYLGRQIAVGSQKPSRITRQKTCCASESNTSVRVIFGDGSGFDAPIGVVLAWRGARIIGFATPIGVVLALEECGSFLDIFRTTNHGRISETLTNYEVKDLLRKCAITSVRVVFANWIVFDAPIGVVLAWEERGSFLNIFRLQIAVGSQKPSQITRQKTCCASESTHRFALYSRTGVVLMLRLESSWHGRSVDHVLTYSG